MEKGTNTKKRKKRFMETLRQTRKLDIHCKDTKKNNKKSSCKY